MNRPTSVSHTAAASVLPVFGDNLRLLTSLNGTQARACAELDISRIQFQRYLRGESFPKPHLLKKICDYFMVDARILTERLDDQLFVEMLTNRVSGTKAAHHGTWLSAIDFAVGGQDYFGDAGSLGEGLYVMWHWCAARKNTVVRRLFKVTRRDGATVLRGYAPREVSAPGTPLKDREYRGLCLNMGNQGYALISFFGKSPQMISMTYVKPMRFSEDSSDTLVGFQAITRDELPGMPRLSRVVIERVGTSPRDLLKQAHMPSFFQLKDLPAAYADLLSSPPA